MENNKKYLTFVANKEETIIRESRKTQTQKKSIISFLLDTEDFRKKLEYIPKYFTIKRTEDKNTIALLFRNYKARLLLNNKDRLENLINKINKFYKKYPNFKETRNQHYTELRIPKIKGGTRILHEPNEDLKTLQKEIAEFLIKDYKVLPHEAAHAYREKRDGISNAKIHRFSNHFIKLDCKDFFPSITENFIKSALNNLIDFAIIKIANDIFLPSEDREAISLLEKLVKEIPTIATRKDNGLPQGSPLSPYISNIVMVEFDYNMFKLSKTNPNLSKTQIMYTRYADDLTFSSLNPINLSDLIKIINENLPKNSYLNKEKTKYLKITNRLFITGAKISRDHRVTYGHKKTAQLKRDIFKLFMAKVNDEDISDLAQSILGTLAYAGHIEKNKAELIINKYAKKFKIDPKTIYKFLLK